MLLLFLLPSTVLAQSALMPEAGGDHSGFRVDVDVWGWSRDFKEMAALGSEVQRYPEGKQRGEAYILIFDVGSITAKQNVHVHYITQADMPHDPVPLNDVREIMWLVDFSWQNMWPKRPIRKQPPGSMTIEPVWDPVPTEGGICSPSMGFLMKWKGQKRYQPHALLKLEAPCMSLRLTDARTYWAKKELGAVMARFDYSPDPNEQSWRFPLAVGWHLGRSLKIVVRGGGEAGKAAGKKLERYGAVKLERGPGEPGGAVVVDYRADLGALAGRVAKELEGTRGNLLESGGTDILIAFGERERREAEPAAAAPPVKRSDAQMQRLDDLDRALDESPNPLKR